LEPLRDVVYDTHDDGVVTKGLRDGDGFVGERLAAFYRTPENEFLA
jgi:hypothetical protein